MTGIFAVDGVDVAGLVAEHLGPRVLAAVLLKPGARGGRDPQDKTRHLPDADPLAHKCRGFIESFSDRTIAQGLVKASDRKVTLLGGTLPAGVEPEGGADRDRVTIEGQTWVVFRVVSRDPAAATYVLQVRDPHPAEAA